MDKKSSGIHQQEVGEGSGVGGPLANILGMCKGYRIRGREEVTQAVVAVDGCRTTSEDRAKIYFGRSMEAAATGI